MKRSIKTTMLLTAASALVLTGCFPLDGGASYSVSYDPDIYYGPALPPPAVVNPLPPAPSHNPGPATPPPSRPDNRPNQPTPPPSHNPGKPDNPGKPNGGHDNNGHKPDNKPNNPNKPDNRPSNGGIDKPGNGGNNRPSHSPARPNSGQRPGSGANRRH